MKIVKDNYLLLEGNCKEALKSFDENSIHCCVTSPPYFGLRDYEASGQIGLNSTVEEYVQDLVEAFREVKRVLRNDGTLWLNLGDSYSSSTAASQKTKDYYLGSNQISEEQKSCITKSGRINKTKASGLKEKDLLGIPWRVAFALQKDGWWLRQDIIWSKPNPMPESVLDRCTKSHEYIFLLSKKAKYYFDNESIKEPAIHANSKKISVKKGGFVSKGEPLGRQLPFVSIKEMKNKRSVWSVNSQPFKGAHFATFPENLILPCIRAGTSEYGCCSKCGSPWRRIKNNKSKSENLDPYLLSNQKSENAQSWQSTCKCQGSQVIPCTILDPFSGAATTGVVALKNKRKFIGIDINPKYIEISEQRIKQYCCENF